MDIFKLGDKILALLEAVFGFWNNQISLIFDLLGQSPYALTLQKAKKLLSGMFSFFNKSYLHQFQNVKAHRLYIR